MKNAKLIIVLCISLAVIVTLSVLIPTLLIKNDPPAPESPTPPADNNKPSTPPIENSGYDYELSDDGKYLYFGEYPQTIKADTVTIESAEPNEDGYYIGSDGEKYFKHIINIDFDSTLYGSEEDWKDLGLATLSNGYTYSQGDALYFKVEKIKWRILSTTESEYFIVSDLILHASIYQDYIYKNSTYYAIDENGEYIYEEDGVTPIIPSVYKYSKLRQFLNLDFYNIAFDTEQKEQILLTTVDNSASTTNNPNNENICENTVDNVFAISFADLTNENFGFAKNNSSIDLTRCFFTTDFAKATGAYTTTAQNLEYDGYATPDDDEWELYSPLIGSGCIMLRSPSTQIHVSVSDLGMVRTSSISDSSLGVCPAIRVKIS